MKDNGEAPQKEKKNFVDGDIFEMLVCCRPPPPRKQRTFFFCCCLLQISTRNSSRCLSGQASPRLQFKKRPLPSEAAIINPNNRAPEKKRCAPHPSGEGLMTWLQQARQHGTDAPANKSQPHLPQGKETLYFFPLPFSKSFCKKKNRLQSFKLRHRLNSFSFSASAPLHFWEHAHLRPGCKKKYKSGDMNT
ncbi:hypothetical protein CEXT_595771 [Caerostris extrusa]|uniref:Uncharacterized protein n=1 Tax=Caerostris extrusa TaxID=172846 RepID=A0AAV4Y1U4_CAEEX|nr:hypothetical protein CEXT_595771 [Caerostris extrusa]